MYYKFLLLEQKYNILNILNIINAVLAIAGIFLPKYLHFSFYTMFISLVIISLLYYNYRHIKIYLYKDNISEKYNISVNIHYTYDKELNEIYYKISLFNNNLFVFDNIKLDYITFHNIIILKI